MTAIGFSGSRKGCSPAQLVWLEEALRIDVLMGVTELHHGDCVGADEVAHDLALNFGIKIVVHPPVDPKYRAYCTGINVEVREPKEYKARDRDIVRETAALYATPEGLEVNYPRSGTWYTVRWAATLNRIISYCLPNGEWGNY
jgi:hypothetical protein